MLMKNCIIKLTLVTLFVTSNYLLMSQTQTDSTMVKIGSNNGQGNLWKKDNSTGTIYNNPTNSNVAIGKQVAQAPLDVNGEINSIKVEGTITADSMHVRSLRVGNNQSYS